MKMNMVIKSCFVILVVFALSISAYAVDKGSIVAYWPCDKGSGQTVADIYGGADGTLMVGPGWAMPTLLLSTVSYEKTLSFIHFGSYFSCTSCIFGKLATIKLRCDDAAEA